MTLINNIKRADLRKLGLVENEAKAYLTLLELGETTVGSVIKKLQIHRQVAYDALGGLVEKNLVEKVIKNGRYHFSLTNPKNLLTEIKKREVIARNIIPKLEKTLKGQRKGQEIKVYEGRKTFKNFILENDRNTPENQTIMVVTGTVSEYLKALGEKSFKESNKIRKNNKIKTKVIFPEYLRENSERTSRNLSEIKFISDQISSPTAFQICHDSVILICYGSEIFFIQIKNKHFKETYENYFKMLWKIAKQ
jgi:sugar-specific transcriptional regulator TrmB